MARQIFLSPPHLGPEETDLLLQAVRSNYIAPVGSFLDQFEAEFRDVAGARHAVAVSSGTAALHLALHTLGVGHGDEVAVSTLTFIGSVAPIVQRGATPVLIDCDDTWNMDPNLLEQALQRHPRIKAVVVVHLYGQPADLDALRGMCDRRGIPIIEDAAEAAGTTYRSRHVGNDGAIGYFSFNGNKIITASTGGMIVTPNADVADHVRKLATQARDPAPHYEHTELGYNFRLSNLLAAVGVAQLRRLSQRVEQRRRNFAYYQEHLSDLPGIRFMPEASFGRSTRWLTTLTIDARTAGVDREAVRQALGGDDIEARPVWKPMHLQPVLAQCPSVLTGTSDKLFADGLCLPSGSSLTEEDLSRVVECIRQVWMSSNAQAVEGRA